MAIRYEDERRLAREWAAHWSIYGKPGGWLYEGNESIVQGWNDLFHALRELRLIDDNGVVSTAYATPNQLKRAYRRYRARSEG